MRILNFLILNLVNITRAKQTPISIRLYFENILIPSAAASSLEVTVEKTAGTATKSINTVVTSHVITRAIPNGIEYFSLISKSFIGQIISSFETPWQTYIVGLISSSKATANACIIGLKLPEFCSVAKIAINWQILDILKIIQ